MGRTLVTGSAGHLGEALMRTLREAGESVIGLDERASAFTDEVGSILERDRVARCMQGVEVVFHTATLHKPHVATHAKQAFVDTNVSGTLALLEAAVAAGVRAFVFTSTTSAFGSALRPAPGEPAVWVTEDVVPVPRNVYGVTKTAAEDLCALFHARHGLACVVLRTSRFFPEQDDAAQVRQAYAGDNAKLNEYAYRRVALEDVVSAHQRAAQRAEALGFGRYIISATTPFREQDLPALGVDAPGVLRRRVPEFEAVYRRLGWRMFPRLDRVYVNDAARRDLGWEPRDDFARVLERVAAGGEVAGPLARAVGSKGYHAEVFEGDAPYPVD